ncbi:MAG: hypothetical protein K2K15_03060 [Anaeroplasmataceae bacterium]|nr:hypothetical protein [Anaeroplasmataceae bacterium]
MTKIFERKIEYGMCDTASKLKIVEIVKLIEAGVASFLKLYQKDNFTMKFQYGALWLFTKTKFQIEELPGWDEDVIVEARRIAYESKLLAVIEIFIHTKNNDKGITAWVECCCARIETRKLLRLSEYDFEIPAEIEDDISFERFDASVEESRKLVVSSSYIDYSHHTNNAEYLRMIMDEFSVAQLEELKIKTVEIHYLAETKEKDELTVMKAYKDGIHYFKIAKDKPVVEVQMKEENAI